MVEESKQLDFAIKNNYELIKPVVRYLDKENILKTDLNIKSPQQNVGKDIAEFNE